MKPIHKLYIKLFLLSIAVYITIVIGYNLVFDDPMLPPSLIAGGIVGAIMNTWFVVSIQKHGLIRLGITELSEENLSTKQSRSVKSAMTFSQLASLIKDRYKQHSVKYNDADQTIEIKKGITLYTWGEQITVSSSPENNTFKISSRPRFIPQFSDNAQNLENVLQIERLISTST